MPKGLYSKVFVSMILKHDNREVVLNVRLFETAQINFLQRKIHIKNFFRLTNSGLQRNLFLHLFTSICRTTQTIARTFFLNQNLYQHQLCENYEWV